MKWPFWKPLCWLDRDYNASLVRETTLAEEVEGLRRKYTTLEANYDKLKQNLGAVSQSLDEKIQVLEVKNRELIECR